MTTPSEITMVNRGGRKASEMTSAELKAARARAAHAREVRKQNAFNRRAKLLEEKESAQQKKEKKADAKRDQTNLVIAFDQAVKAYEAKIASLEHQAIQYRTVIDYLESKIDSQRLSK
jgi:predicted  nucleic acid-binding Zn-ribbon protein